MSNNKIPDCCVAAIRQSVIDSLNFERRLPDVTYLRCDHCGESYRFSIFSREPLGSEVDGTWYDVIYDCVVYVEGQHEVKPWFQCFVEPSQPKYHGSFKFVYYHKEPEQIHELQA